MIEKKGQKLTMIEKIVKFVASLFVQQNQTNRVYGTQSKGVLGIEPS